MLRSEAAAEPRGREFFSAAVDLHARLIAGDEDVFARFVDTHYPALRRIAQWAARPLNADDMVQQAFREFCEQLPVLDPTRVRAEPYRALLHAVRQDCEAQGEPDPLSVTGLQAEMRDTSVPRERFLNAEHRWNGGWAVPPLPFPKAEVEAEVETEAAPRAATGTLALLDAELERLPLRLRLIVLLRDVAGLSLLELSALLELPELQARRALHVGRSLLRAALETYYRHCASALEAT